MDYLTRIAESIAAKVERTVGAEDELLYLIYAVLARTKGVYVSAEDVHDAWTAWMLMKGERHESMVPFNELPAQVQQEDQPFVRAIREVAKELAH